MRFVIAVEVLVEAGSVEELDALADEIESAAAASAQGRLSRDRADRGSSSVCIEARDEDSLEALVRAAHWAAANGIRGAESPAACQLPREPQDANGQ